jgi:hypothetical protein
MQAASDWLRENPDKDDPFLRVPEYMRIRQKHEDDRLDGELAFKRAASLTAKLPHHAAVAEIDASLEKLTDNIGRAAYSFGEVDKSMRVVEDYINEPTDEGLAKIQTTQEILGRFLVAWGRDGYNVFDLSPDFVAAMLLTDSREIDIARTRLPFGGILILIPDGFARDGEGRSYTKIHVNEITEREASMLTAAKNVNKELGKLPRDEAREILDRATKDAKNTPAFINNSMEKLLTPFPGSRLCIHATTGTIGFNFVVKRDGLTWDKIDAANEDIEHPEDLHVVHTIQMLVFSTLAYINAVKTALEPVEVQRKERKAKTTEQQPKRWTVGRTIKLHPELVRAARQGSHEITFRLKHRHIVRGHFKQQAYGSNHSLRKEIYVEAYWKGPENGAALVHTYKPKAPNPWH